MALTLADTQATDPLSGMTAHCCLILSTTSGIAFFRGEFNQIGSSALIGLGGEGTGS